VALALPVLAWKRQEVGRVAGERLCKEFFFGRGYHRDAEADGEKENLPDTNVSGNGKEISRVCVCVVKIGKI